MIASYLSLPSSAGRRINSSRSFGRNIYTRQTVSRSITKERVSLARKRCMIPPRAVTTDKASARKSDTSSKKSTEIKKNVDNEVTSEVAKMLYKDMMMGRDFEEKCAEMYYRGKMFGYVSMIQAIEIVFFLH